MKTEWPSFKMSWLMMRTSQQRKRNRKATPQWTTKRCRMTKKGTRKSKRSKRNKRKKRMSNTRV